MNDLYSRSAEVYKLQRIEESCTVVSVELMRVKGASVLTLKGLMSALRAGGNLGVPSLWSVGESC